MNTEEFREKLKTLADEIIEVVDEFEQNSKLQFKVKEGSFEWAIANLKAGNRVNRKNWRKELYLSICTITEGSLGEMKIIVINNGYDSEAWMPTIRDFTCDDWKVI